MYSHGREIDWIMLNSGTDWGINDGSHEACPDSDDAPDVPD